MSKSQSPKKVSELSNLLATAEAQERAAQAAAAAEARRVHKADKKEATDATDAMYEAVAHATGAAKADGGYPAVTRLMNGIADFAINGGAGNSPVPSGYAVEPSSQGGASQADYDFIDEKANRLQGELDDAKETIGNLEGAVQTVTEESVRIQADLNQANTDNRNLTTQLEGKNRELQTKETELGTTTENLNDANRKLSEAQATIRDHEETISTITNEKDQLQGELAAIVDQVRALPEINLTKKVWGTGGKQISVPREQAERLNNGRAYLRQTLGLDPASSEEEPATPAEDEHLLPAMQ